MATVTVLVFVRYGKESRQIPIDVSVEIHGTLSITASLTVTASSGPRNPTLPSTLIEVIPSLGLSLSIIPEQAAGINDPTIGPTSGVYDLPRTQGAITTGKRKEG